MDMLSESNSEDEYVEISDDDMIEIIPKIEDNDNVQIFIAAPIIVENNYVLYPIVGNDTNGKFESKRRYSEFTALRETLKCQWPGCYIPHIPPKMLYGNLWQNAVDQRKKLLEAFLQKIMKIPHLYQSDLAQSFLKSSQGILKTQAKLSYFQLSQIYENIFHDYSNFIANEEHFQKLEDEKRYFIAHLNDLKLFENNCKWAVWSFADYHGNLQKLYNGLKGISKFYAKDKDIKIHIKELENNPYSLLEDWTKSVILDIEALIETIACIDGLKGEFKKIRENQVEERKNLYELQRGNLGIFQMLAMKPKEYYIEESKLQLNRLDKEAGSLEKIINIAVGQLLNCEIPKLKEGRANLETTIQSCLNLSVNNLEMLIKQKKQIKQWFH